MNKEYLAFSFRKSGRRENPFKPDFLFLSGKTREVNDVRDYMKKRDYEILIYDKENRESYEAAIRALTVTKEANGWDSVQGVIIHKDCRIPELYHGEDLAIIMERDTDGDGRHRIKIMN